MAIINTLITARDDMSDTINKVAKNTKAASKDIKNSLDSANDSAESLESSFDSLRNFDTSSLSGAISSFKKISQQLNEADGRAAKFLVTSGLLVGGIALVGAGFIAAVNSSSEFVKGLNETSKASGVTIERLQQMQTVFRGTGVEVEKFGDINKDTLDHLGDAFRDGSGPAADLKAYGLNLQDFNKYLNKTNGGIDAVVHTFYEMRKAGKSQAEITNVLETLASDSSHLVGVLKNYGSEQEALNAINQTHVGITEDTARAYQEYESKVEQLSTTFKSFQASALAPVVEDLTKILDMINGDWSAPSFQEMVKNVARFVGNDSLLSIPYNMAGGGQITSSIAASDAAAKSSAEMANSPQYQAPDPTGGYVNKEQEAKAAAAAAKAAAAQAKAFQARQDQASKWLAQLDINNATEQKKSDLNYDVQLKQLDKFLSDKLINQEQYEHGVQALNSQLTAANDKIVYDRQIQAAEQAHNRGLTGEYEYQQKIIDLKSSYQKQQADNEFNTEMERLDYLHNAKLIKEQDYLDQVAGITAKHNYELQNNSDLTNDMTRDNQYKQQAADLQAYADVMSQSMNIASQFGEAVASSAEQGSAAWYAATIATKTMAVVQAVIMANLAAAQALADPSALTAAQKIVQSETVRAIGYANAAMIAATAVMQIAGARETGGQVKAGGTYLVGEKGPELMQVGATGQITSNANMQKAMGGGGGDMHFSQTLIMQGSGISEQDAVMIKTMTEATVEKAFHTQSRRGGLLTQKS